MTTPSRSFQNDYYYHVYNRGNRKQAIFTNYRDYERFLTKVIDYKKKYPVRIIAYCLMPNHFHFLIQQLSPNALSKFMSDLCNSHSRYFNVKYELVGSLLQGRFKAKLIDNDEYLVHVSRYIHLNPVDLFPFAGKDLWERITFYKWSSLSTYMTGKSNEIVTVEPILDFFSSKNPVLDYREFVESNMQVKTDPVIESLIFEE